MENPIKKIDFTTLRGQKATLLDVIKKLEEGCKDQLEIDDLTGILHLIDSIQDYAVDELGVNEMHVYDFELEEERENAKPMRTANPRDFEQQPNETDEEFFARVNAQTIFWMHIEGTFLYENEDMSEEFIKSIVDDEKHATAIKDKIRRDILKDVETNPDNFEKDDDGKLTYDASMYDYGFAIEEYCREIFNEGKTKCVHLCMSCGSDNVQVKAWVKPNQGNTMVDEVEGDELGWCSDCQQNVNVDTASLKASAKVVGYQVVGEDGSEQDGEIHHQMDGSFCLYSLEQARSMMDDNDNGKERWRLLTIWSGDVEEPTFMFEGDPRNPTENYPSTNTIG